MCAHAQCIGCPKSHSRKYLCQIQCVFDALFLSLSFYFLFFLILLFLPRSFPLSSFSFLILSPFLIFFRYYFNGDFWDALHIAECHTHNSFFKIIKLWFHELGRHLTRVEEIDEACKFTLLFRR